MRRVFGLDHRHQLPPSELAALIGGKAAGLWLMASELGLPVPPGFTITTEACRAYLSDGWPPGLDEELRTAISELEAITARGYGDQGNPLLLSVRSGAPVSMPGMMDTILNLGLNDGTVQGLAAASGDPSFAADSRRRLVEMFTRIVGAATVPDDPWQQLRAAVEAIFRSWNSDRARAYRSREGIPDVLGTAVTVQTMVFGNWGPDSATGVLFTRNPATGEPSIYGDVLFSSQGEDVVAGTHRTERLAALDTRMPAVAAELRRFASALERHFADLCDIEFTIERGKLWLLQVRVGKRSPRAALRIAHDMAEDPGFPLTREQAVERVSELLAHPPLVAIPGVDRGPALARGLPASPGIASGEIATSSSQAVSAAEAGRAVVLVRSETSPDDVGGMAKAVGVLTSRGGLASHAAVVARGWGIPAVVGAEAVTVADHSVDISGRTMSVGETISIDGGTGEIFAGVVEGSTRVAPEAAAMLAWAGELGIAVGARAAAPESAGATGQAATADDVVRALLIKGSATSDQVASALLTDPLEVHILLGQLEVGGLVERVDDAYRLSGAGKVSGRELHAADRMRWGDAQAIAALDAFLSLDHQVKEVVTRWQLRNAAGAPTINDHTDPAYDAGVLDQLDGLYGQTATWLSNLGEAPAVLRRYLWRLERALHAARAGDQRFVASPRVDSYHSVWFELHEELILLSGKTRAEEAAAGRA